MRTRIYDQTAFPNDVDGNREAKILFSDLIAEDDSNLLEEEIEGFVASDKYEKSNYVIKVVVSSIE
jgi:hypothetical protein